MPGDERTSITSRYQLAGAIAATLAVLFTLFGSLFAFWQSTGATNAQVITLQSDVAYMKARARELESSISRLEASQARTEAQLIEIETKFCESDIVRNLMHASDQRFTSLLWQKVNGVPIPIDNTYYPMICDRIAATNRR